MKFTTLLVSLVLTATVSAKSSWFNPSQITVNEEFKVPGDNPLYFCSDPADDILTIENVDLSPNPPEP